MGMNTVFDANHLYASFIKTSSETGWKESTQRYKMNILREIMKQQNRWNAGRFELGKTHNFVINERGHTRYIKSHTIEDRVVLTSYVDYVLKPKILPRMIYDNGASQEGKGVSFTRRRFCVHLNRAFLRWGTRCYIRFFDFRKFFDNISHDIALDMMANWLEPDELDFAKIIFRHFESDLSYLTDSEFLKCRDGVYDSLQYPDKPGNRLKMLRKGVGIGSPVSQITGIFFPYPVDNLCKNRLSIPEYGRYADDFYIIRQTKEELNRAEEQIADTCQTIGLTLNDKKTRTFRLDEEYTFLKIVYTVREDGRIIARPCAETMRRERKRIGKMEKKIASGEIPKDEVLRNYASWRGGYERFDAGSELMKMDRYAHEHLKGG